MLSFVTSLSLILSAFGAGVLARRASGDHEGVGRDVQATLRHFASGHIGYSTFGPGLIMIATLTALYAGFLPEFYWPVVGAVIGFGAFMSHLTVRFLMVILKIDRAAAAHNHASYFAPRPLLRSVTLLVCLVPPIAVACSLGLLTIYR